MAKSETEILRDALIDLMGRVTALEKIVNAPPCFDCGGTGLRLTDGSTVGPVWSSMTLFTKMPEAIPCSTCKGTGRAVPKEEEQEQEGGRR